MRCYGVKKFVQEERSLRHYLQRYESCICDVRFSHWLHGKLLRFRFLSGTYIEGIFCYFFLLLFIHQLQVTTLYNINKVNNLLSKFSKRLGNHFVVQRSLIYIHYKILVLFAHFILFYFGLLLFVRSHAHMAALQLKTLIELSL